jgi:hypothetical protein
MRQFAKISSLLRRLFPILSSPHILASWKLAVASWELALQIG